MAGAEGVEVGLDVIRISRMVFEFARDSGLGFWLGIGVEVLVK
jgi:hypothetical protein